MSGERKCWLKPWMGIVAIAAGIVTLAVAFVVR